MTELAPMTSRRILLADDNADAVGSLAMILDLDGHQTRVAYDGTQALELALAYRPEVMLLDISMPGMTGHEVARRIRSESWGAEVLLLAASGWTTEEDHARSVDAGFDYHLVKPLEYERLCELLARPSLR